MVNSWCILVWKCNFLAEKRKYKHLSFFIIISVSIVLERYGAEWTGCWFLPKYQCGSHTFFCLIFNHLWVEFLKIYGFNIDWSLYFFIDNDKVCFLLSHLTRCFFQLLGAIEYHKVASSSLSRLVAHFKIFRRLMKGKSDAYVLWPLAKNFNWIVDRSTAHNFTAYAWSFSEWMITNIFILECSKRMGFT